MFTTHVGFRSLGLISLIVMSCAQAQPARVDPGDDSQGQVETHAGGDSPIVHIEGQVISAASGPGAVAITRIGGRSLNAHSKNGEMVRVVIEGEGPDGRLLADKNVTEAPAQVRQDFVNVDLSGRDFTGARLSGRVFINANLSGASLRGADLRGTQWINVDLGGADLSGADLTGAELVNTDLGVAITTGLKR